MLHMHLISWFWDVIVRSAESTLRPAYRGRLKVRRCHQYPALEGLSALAEDEKSKKEKEPSICTSACTALKQETVVWCRNKRPFSS